MDQSKRTSVFKSTKDSRSLRIPFDQRSLRSIEPAFMVKFNFEKGAQSPCRDKIGKDCGIASANSRRSFSNCRRSFRKSFEHWNSCNRWLSKSSNFRRKTLFTPNFQVWHPMEDQVSSIQAAANVYIDARPIHTCINVGTKLFCERDLDKKTRNYFIDAGRKFCALRTHVIRVRHERRKIPDSILSSSNGFIDKRAGQCIQELVLFLTLTLGITAFCFNQYVKISNEWKNEVNKPWFTKSFGH